MKLSELEARSLALSAPRSFVDPLTGKSRVVMLRLDPDRAMAYQIDLANHEWRSQKMGHGGEGFFSRWSPLEPEPAAARPQTDPHDATAAGAQ